MLEVLPRERKMFNCACGNLTTVRAWNWREILIGLEQGQYKTWTPKLDPQMYYLLDPTREKEENIRWFSQCHHQILKSKSQGLLHVYTKEGEDDLVVNLFTSFQFRDVFRFENTAFWIGHFRVHVCFLFKASLSAKFFLWKLVFIHMQSGTNYHHKNFALRLALKRRLTWTRK